MQTSVRSRFRSPSGTSSARNALGTAPVRTPQVPPGRRNQLAVAVAVLLLTVAACGRQGAGDGEQAEGQRTAEETAKSESPPGDAKPRPLTPKELLVGKWKRTIAIDKAKLEPWLERGGYEKLPPSREELLAQLDKIVAAEETVEYRIDGTMSRSSQSSQDELTWKVLDETDYRVQIEVRAASMKGPDKVVAVSEYDIVFRTEDVIVVDDDDYRHMPLTKPVWHRLSRGTLQYTGSDAAKGPPPFRKKAVPKDSALVEELEALGLDAGLNEQGEVDSIQRSAIKRPSRPDWRKALPLLRKMPALEWLRIGDGSITDADMAHLAGLQNLKHLSLGANNVTADGFRLVHNLPRLEHLSLSFTQIGDEGLSQLREMPSLREIDLADTPITDDGIKYLAGMTKLAHLKLTSTAIGDGGFRHLKGLVNLQRLEAGETRITGKALAHLAGMSRLKVLDLRKTAVDDAGLEYLRGLTSLVYLELMDTQVGNDGMRYLTSLAALRELCLNGSHVDDAGLEHLKGLRSLDTLYLHRTPVTNAGLVQLRKALPKCNIYCYIEKRDKRQ